MQQTIEFTPPWLAKGKPEKEPVFTLRAASVLERDQFEAEMDGRHRAGLVPSFQLLEVAVSGIETLMDGEDAQQLTELLRSEFDDAGALSPAEKAQVKIASETLAQHWPDYAALVEREARRSAVLPTLAFMRWCDGWERVKDHEGKLVEYRRDQRGDIPDEVLRRVPFPMIRTAGMEAYGLQYGRTQAKN